MREWEKLTLSEKSIWEYDPQSFRAHVDSLHGIRSRKSQAKPSTGINFRLNAKGSPVLTCKRDWKWITEAELESISKEHRFPLNRLWIYVKERGFTVVKDAVKAIGG